MALYIHTELNLISNSQQIVEEIGNLRNMGTFLILLLILCSILFIYRFLIKIFQTQKTTLVNGKSLQLPPGSKGWPFVGETLDFIYYMLKGVPHKFVEERRKKYSTKVFKTSLLGESMAILCGAEGNKFLFSNENKLVRVWLPPSIGQLIPWTSNKSTAESSRIIRKMSSSFLKIDALRKSIRVMDLVMKQHLQSDWSSDKVEVSSMAKKYASGLTCQLLFSINESKKIDEFSKQIEVIDKALDSIHINLPGTNLNRGIKASKVLRVEIEKIVKQRRIDIAEKCSSTVPQDAITNMLLCTDDNGQFLNEFDISSNLLGLKVATYGSVHKTIASVMMHLSDLSDVYDRVLREQMEIAESKEPNDLLTWDDLSRMKYTWNVVCEVLRLSVQLGTFREAITDFEYAGYLIPKGWKMHWMASATHRNPKYFQDPDKFDPTRFEGNGPAPYTFVPFGGGARMCPGNEYARLVILVYIHNVVTKFRWKKLIADEKLQHRAMSSPAKGLPIHLYSLKS